MAVIASKRMRGRAWMRLRLQVLQSEPLCRPCRQKGRTTAATEVDHIRAIRLGGTDDAANLQPICHWCHRDKTYRDMNGGKDKPKPIRAPDW